MQRPVQFLGELAAALGLAACGLAPIAWQRLGTPGLAALAATVVSCWLPGAALMALAPRVRGIQRELAILLIGTLLRGGIVMVAALLVLAWRPEVRSVEYFLGLAILYCVALAVETRALLAELRLTPARQPQST